MPTRPPGPVRGRNDQPGHVTVTSDIDGAVVMTARGQWDWRLFLDLYTGVHKCLAERPAALIVELNDLVDPTTDSASLWLTACRAGAAMHPPVQVALCLPPTTRLAERLHRLGAKRFLPVYSCLAEARAAVATGLPLTDQLQLGLPPEPASARRARALVVQACRAWHLPQLLDRARLVVSELVANSIEHAGTDLSVTVSRRGDGLHLAVRDGSPTLPRLLHPAPADPGAPRALGRGVRLVNATAAAWGAFPLPNGGGKIVWATVRSENPYRACTAGPTI
jgi:Histidine kinase-like ATPase domain